MPLSLSHNTLKCIVTCLMPFLATIQHVYCDTLLPSSHCPSCCVTIQFLCIKTQSLSPLAFLLQYSPTFISAIQNHCIATQKPLYQPSKTTILQNKIFFHNIIWAVAQKRFCTKFFFFHYSFFLISSYWKNSEKNINTYIFFFIFFNTQINLQKFIFFNFTPYKTLENYFLHLVTE